MFRRILIANRGEIAVRIARSCEALGIEAVGIHSEVDNPPLKKGGVGGFAQSICIGPAPASQSYLNQDAILKAAIETDCEAIHPGYGFLSENALFATRCEQQKLTFIGPKPYQIRLMGDKATAVKTMASVGLPVLPGSSAILQDSAHARELAKDLGYPVLLKATAGGGGKGMRLVRSAKDLPAAFQEASAEAEKAFGNAGLYLEKFIEGARHIEFQVLADAYGKVVCLGERDCSIQQRHQKLVEEAPAPGMSSELRMAMSEQISHALRKIGYLGAGTLEFLMGQDGQLYFMEMNTRIQVEHTITEEVTGLDLVAWQIKIAAGERLDISYHGPKGHAIEARINALAPGKISRLKIPEGVRFDSYIQEGTVVTPYYDSMIAKLIVHAETREKAVKALQRALGELVIEGVSTTREMHLAISEDKRFMRGKYSCAFFEDFKWPK
jgi:acetyl-CoA carboxylase biotin carboxylase subunit